MQTNVFLTNKFINNCISLYALNDTFFWGITLRSIIDLIIAVICVIKKYILALLIFIYIYIISYFIFYYILLFLFEMILFFIPYTFITFSYKKFLRHIFICFQNSLTISEYNDENLMYEYIYILYSTCVWYLTFT